MQIGISTACLYPMELEVSLNTLLKLGFRVFEIFFNTFSEVEPAYLRGLSRELEAYGARVRSVHPFTSGYEGLLFFSAYERRFWDTVDFYKRYFDAANLLGAEIIVLHGQRDYRMKKDMTEEGYLERYAALYHAGKEYGVMVAQENVDSFRSENPAFIRRMRTSLGENCAFVFDVKQAVRAGFDPFEMCAAMGERLVHVHLNDNSPGRDCLLPGNGGMDYARLQTFLNRLNYRGDAVIEVYRDSFTAPEELLASKNAVQPVFCNNK